MPSDNETPRLDDATVTYAATLAGDGLPKITDSEREIWMKLGRLDLARELRLRLEIQEGRVE